MSVDALKCPVGQLDTRGTRTKDGFKLVQYAVRPHNQVQRRGELSDELKQRLASVEASGPKLINIDVIDAPREVVVAQSPEHLLRQCKKKLRSKRIFFTGKADRNDVVQLLSDFEDSIAVEFDQKRARNLNLLTKDLEQALAEKLGEARRARSRMLL